jgi:hypothetical protein
MKLKVSDLKPADYNPRLMDSDTKEALKTSMKEFSDISGITWNRTTGNIVTGHHRWANLLDLYGEGNLDFKPLTKTRFAIINKAEKEDTGFVLRVVEWDEVREKAANITANSTKLSGNFTAELDAILEDIKPHLDHRLLNDLRLFDMDFSGITEGLPNAGDWVTDIDDIDKIGSSLDGITSTIKIECPQEMKSELADLIKNHLEAEGFADKVKVK